MSKGILVVGSLNMDMSISLDSIPAVGETVLGNDLFYIFSHFSSPFYN